MGTYTKMDQVEFVTKPVLEFGYSSHRLLNKCTKPDRKEFKKIAFATGIGFAVMGFIGFFVKLIHIPINKTNYCPWRISAAPVSEHIQDILVMVSEICRFAQAVGQLCIEVVLLGNAQCKSATLVCPNMTEKLLWLPRNCPTFSQHRVSV